jgi:hypothetical protein
MWRLTIFGVFHICSKELLENEFAVATTNQAAVTNKWLLYDYVPVLGVLPNMHFIELDDTSADGGRTAKCINATQKEYCNM